MKTMALLVRRADHSRDAFREHYEDIHAPLAMETVMEGTTRYVRHHLDREVFGEPFFDVVTAFQYASAEAVAGLMRRLESEQGAAIIADEHTFMDRDRNTFFTVTEHAVLGEEDRDAGVSVMALVRAPDGADPGDFVSAYERDDVPALLDAAGAPVWCLQNRAVPIGPERPAYDAATQLHAAALGAVRDWAAALEARGAAVVVATVREHETETPWG